MLRPVRDIAVPLAIFALALVLGIHVMTVAFVVAGYAHFLQGYAYRLRSAGRVDFLNTGLPVLILLLLAIYFYLGGPPLVVLLLTPIIFSAHFAFDEFFLHDETVYGVRWLVPLSFVLLVVVLSAKPILVLYAPLLTAVTFVVMALIGIRLVFTSSASVTEWHLSFLCAILCIMSAFQYTEFVIAMIVLLHCYNWYDRSYVRLRNQPARLVAFWRDVLVTISAVVVVWGISTHVYAIAPLFSFDQYYYVYYPVALAHIASSIRFGMLKG